MELISLISFKKPNLCASYLSISHRKLCHLNLICQWWIRYALQNENIIQEEISSLTFLYQLFHPIYPGCLKLVRGWWVVEGNFKGTGRGKPSNFFLCRFLCIYCLPYLHPPSLQGSMSLQTLETNKIIRYVSPAFSHTQLINFLRLVTQSLCGGTRDNPMRTGYQTCIFPYFFYSYSYFFIF